MPTQRYSHARRTPARLASTVLAALGQDEVTLRLPDILALDSMCKPQKVEAGTRLLRAGQAVHDVFVIADGAVELRSTGRRGRRVCGVLRDGAVMADVALLLGKPIPFDAVAARSSSLVQVDGAGLLALLGRSPGLGLRWALSVADRHHRENLRLRNVLTGSLQANVAALLLEEREPGSHEGVVHLSHEVIAGMLGVRRPSVSRTIGELRARGYVHSGYRCTLIDDAAALGEFARRGGALHTVDHR